MAQHTTESSEIESRSDDELPDDLVVEEDVPDPEGDRPE